LKILVTGATGFTGGALARRLRSDGHDVRALVRPGSDRSELEWAGVECVEGQLVNGADVDRAARGCDQVYHLAAVFRTAGHGDQHYRDINVGGTINVLRAARKHDCERVVHCSTGGVHGHIEDPPADEGYRVRPGDIYQQTKLEGELEARSAIASGQPVAIFRPGAIYGPGDLRMLKLFKMIRDGRFRMIGSGRPHLHLTYIDDLVSGIVRLGQSDEALGEVFLLAGCDAPVLTELAQLIGDAVGVRVPGTRIPVWPVYLAGLLCELACVPFGIEPPLHRRRVGFFTHNREFDIAKAQRLLGYAPQVAAAEGVRRTAAWYVEQGLVAPPPLSRAAQGPRAEGSPRTS